MKACTIVTDLFVMCFVLCVGATGYAEGGALVKGTTLENLNSAFNGESNANARYIAFAAKAESEGYLGAAALFRAAAAAEKVHFTHLAKVIVGMGGTPVSEIKAPDVKSTRENLQAALAGEAYERDTMYPAFLAQAKAEKNKAAARTFNLALQAEAQHAKLYTRALGDLESMKIAQAFFVCPECGFTDNPAPDPKCPVCGVPREKFMKVV
jgi:rubrerythrin